MKAGHLKLDVALQFIPVLIWLSTWPLVVPWVFDICTEESIVVDAVYLLSRVWLFRNPMDCSQAPLFMGFPRQEFWSGLPFPFPRDLPDPGIRSVSLARFLDHWATREAHEEGIKIPKHITQSFKTMISILICFSEKVESRGQVEITQPSLVLHIYLWTTIELQNQMTGLN